MVCAPDAGRVKTAERLRKELHSDLAFLYKRRSRQVAHKIEEVVVVGDVEGRRCILIDDMVDTAGTMVEGAKAPDGDGRHGDLRRGHPCGAVRAGRPADRRVARSAS